MPNFTLDVISEYLLRNKVSLKGVQSILSDYGITVRREPMGVTYWKAGRRIHGVFNFNPAEI